MEEGRGHEDSVIGSDLETVNRVAGVVEGFSVGEKGAFGHPGGAGCVHQDGRGVGRNGDGCRGFRSPVERGFIGLMGTAHGDLKCRRMGSQGEGLLDQGP